MTGHESGLVLKKDTNALIVVDMQNGLLDKRGFMAKLGLPVEYLIPTLGPVKRLVEFCRSQGVPVIFTRYILRPDYSDAGRFAEVFPTAKDKGAMISGTWGVEIHPELGPQPSDYVVDKTRYTAFYNTNLDAILEKLQVATLVVCGVTTEMCVESTIRDAFFRDYRIVLVKDAVAAVDPVRHEGTLRTIGYGFGDLATVDEVILAMSDGNT